MPVALRVLVVRVLLSVGEIKRARKFAEIAYEHAGGRLKEAIAAVAKAGPARPCRAI